jgi:hypothetical protein
MKIDIFSHVLTKKVEAEMHKRSLKDAIVDAVGTKRKITDFQQGLWDMDFRLRMMDKYEDLVHVLTPTNFPIELIPDPENARETSSFFVRPSTLMDES